LLLLLLAKFPDVPREAAKTDLRDDREDDAGLGDMGGNRGLPLSDDDDDAAAADDDDDIADVTVLVVFGEGENRPLKRSTNELLPASCILFVLGECSDEEESVIIKLLLEFLVVVDRDGA
jgi:hypothetical protein